MSGISKRVSGSWVSGDYGIMGTATDTLTTLPAVLYPNDTTATVSISGNMEQNGTPTPDNPVMPQGTGERTGNLFDNEILQNNKGISSYGNVFDQNGRIATVTPINISGYSEVTLTYTGDNVSFIYATFNSGTLVERVGGKKSGYTINTTNCDSLYICFYGSSSITKDDVSEIMLNLGSTALPYQPYGYKIPILSASTTTPVYLGEVESTRRIRELVLTGEENWKIISNGFAYIDTITDYSKVNGNISICTHFRTNSSVISAEYAIDGVSFYNAPTENYRLYIKDSTLFTTITTLKSWLAEQYAAGTPVIIWYVLATETTGIVNEPLRKIGNYADTVSGITIPTTEGADSFDVLTTLKPSEVELTYTGWHDASVEEWDGSEWQ